jgi:hypothetical protein
MTKDEIIEMARQAHRKLVTEVYVGHMGQLDPWTIELLKIFAKLVAQHEREACAKVCDEYADDSRTGATCAKVIRTMAKE